MMKKISAFTPFKKKRSIKIFYRSSKGHKCPETVLSHHFYPSRLRLGYGRKRLGYGRKRLGYGRKRLSYGRKRLGYGRKRLGYGR